MKDSLEHNENCDDDFEDDYEYIDDLDDLDYTSLDLMSLFDCGHERPESYEDAWKLYLPEAEGGSADAQFNIGYMYQHGCGVQPSMTDAVEWLGRSADQGNADALYLLGLIYARGDGLEKSYEKAYEYFTKASEAGNIFAYGKLGVMYEFGLVVEQSYEKAFEFYKLDVGDGDSYSAWEILYLNDMGHYNVPKELIDEIESHELFDVYDLCELGNEYHSGHYYPKSLEKAATLYRMASDRGSPEGCYMLGRMYEEGRGVERDPVKAASLYEKSLEDECYDYPGESEYRLGILYEKGDGVERNLETAFDFYSEAAFDEIPEAMYKVGTMMENGIGVGKDLEAAIGWYESAAECGCTEAEESLKRLGVYS